MLKGFTLTMWVGFGGFLGTVMRYWMAYGMQKSLGVRFPTAPCLSTCWLGYITVLKLQ